MTLKIIADSGQPFTITEADAPEIIGAFEEWRGASPRSLQESQKWDAVFDCAAEYLANLGHDLLVDNVEFIN